MSKRPTAIIQTVGSGFLSLYSELDIASHGDTVEETRNNLHESLELSFECGLSAEFEQRPCGELFVTQVAVKC